MMKGILAVVIVGSIFVVSNLGEFVMDIAIGHVDIHLIEFKYPASPTN